MPLNVTKLTVSIPIKKTINTPTPEQVRSHLLLSSSNPKFQRNSTMNDLHGKMTEMPAKFEPEGFENKEGEIRIIKPTKNTANTAKKVLKIFKKLEAQSNIQAAFDKLNGQESKPKNLFRIFK